ncbi:putative glycosyltransferase [Actinacidiphila reveromycinica]|uniref:Putative glycosyltransferase n=1 Tax=Actinacidiphila reveromycinica TaxID=659352 RepID=A0A7U3UMW5_9ACTN|nr:putative glycosyltransferase [Streptomyces sp. SN-593]
MAQVTADSVDVVLPCLNEAAALPWVLERIPAGWRAVVVDNGSDDGSAEVARALGATVVHEPRRGFGAACHAGLLAATAATVCFCDCDASLDPGLLTGFVREIAAGRTDLVLGRRRPVGRGAWPAHARAGNAALSHLLRRRTGLRLRDLGPMRAARREALLALDLTDRRSGYPLQMVVRAADAGWRVRETDVPYLPRTGTSKVTGTWRGTWHAVRDMRKVLAEPATAPLAHARPARPASSAPPAPVPAPAPATADRPGGEYGSHGRRRTCEGGTGTGAARLGDAAAHGEAALFDRGEPSHPGEPPHPGAPHGPVAPARSGADTAGGGRAR